MSPLMVHGRRNRAALILALVAWSCPGIPVAQAATRFDGSWDVTVVCQPAADGAAGYSLEFNAQVEDGLLRGDNGTAGRPGSLHIEGRIQPDGTSLLSANGLTAAPVYSIGRVPPLTPYSYTVSAHFDLVRGTGTRTGTRRCTVSFARP